MSCYQIVCVSLLGRGVRGSYRGSCEKVSDQALRAVEACSPRALGSVFNLVGTVPADGGLGVSVTLPETIRPPSGRALPKVVIPWSNQGFTTNLMCQTSKQKVMQDGL